jgi:flagellar biosynthesis/type III secretory pathway protein FliH
MKGAVRMVLVHNHPSENLTPSEDDQDITDRLIQVGNIVGIEVVEHLIISLERYFSFERTGLLKKLKLSKKWVPAFIEEERLRKEKEKIREEAIKIGKKEGIKEGKKIGKQMGLEKGIKKGKIEGLKEGEKIGIKKGVDKGLKEGQKIGLDKGLDKGKKEIAQKSLKEGLSIELISKLTGLSGEEIEKL